MTDTAAPDVDIIASDIAWDLSTLLTGASADSPSELVDRAEAIAGELPGVVVVRTADQGNPA